MSAVEIAWRAKRLAELTTVAGFPVAMAEQVIAREALWTPWEPVTVRFPTIRNYCTHCRR